MPDGVERDTRAAEPSHRGRRGFVAAAALSALVGFAAGDSLRPAGGQVSAKAGIAAIDVYRATAGAALARTGIVRCRFDPSCSAYGREAIARYGSPRGYILTAQRLLRCHPFSRGGPDPVP
jgi:putative membrane protein insertion efficiency factor